MSGMINFYKYINSKLYITKSKLKMILNIIQQDPGVSAIWLMYPIVLFMMFRYYYLLDVVTDHNNRKDKFKIVIIKRGRYTVNIETYLISSKLTINVKTYVDIRKWKINSFVADKLLLHDLSLL